MLAVKSFGSIEQSFQAQPQRVDWTKADSCSNALKASFLEPETKDNPGTCRICKARFLRPEAAVAHVTKSHYSSETMEFACPVAGCDFASSSNGGLCLHINAIPSHELASKVELVKFIRPKSGLIPTVIEAKSGHPVPAALGGPTGPARSQPTVMIPTVIDHPPALPSNSNESSRKCPSCDKVFRNSKALSAHRPRCTVLLSKCLFCAPQSIAGWSKMSTL